MLASEGPSLPGQRVRLPGAQLLPGFAHRCRVPSPGTPVLAVEYARMHVCVCTWEGRGRRDMLPFSRSHCCACSWALYFGSVGSLKGVALWCSRVGVCLQIGVPQESPDCPHPGLHVSTGVYHFLLGCRLLESSVHLVMVGVGVGCAACWIEEVESHLALH